MSAEVIHKVIHGSPAATSPREGHGHCVQRALLGARDTNLLLRAAKWIMFGNAQPLNLVKQWLRALPDGPSAPHGGGARASLRGPNGQLFNFAPNVVGAPRDVLISLRHHMRECAQTTQDNLVFVLG